VDFQSNAQRRIGRSSRAVSVLEAETSTFAFLFLIFVFRGLCVA
jgi:hypothetical protein